MNVKKIITLLLAALLVLSLAACGKQGSDDTTKPDGEPKNAQEAAAMYKDLMDQENAILTENQSLWEKVFQSADKGMTTQEDGKNYGDFLLDTIESAKDKFTADELKLLRQGGEKIREIERTLAAIEAKFPDAAPKAPGNGDSIPADSPTTPGDSDKTQKFPAFEGKDLNGNTVKSDDLFSKNAVTVVNFWFTTCNPCVEELADLEALNKQLAKKGGAVVGINSFTLDGDKTAISDAKNILAKKGVTYKNIWFDSKSKAGEFTSGLYSYPTTYVVDKNGNIVGEPIVGAITSEKQSEKLQKLIDQAIANSKN